MECGVCLEAMPCASFVSPTAAAASVAVVLENEHRFRCGHAFHANCAVQSLLASRKCPTCRASLDGVDASSEDDDAPTALWFPSPPAAGASDPNMLRNPVLARVRSLHEGVRTERRAFRAIVANYNRLHDRMRHRRRAAIQEALGAFRRRHYAACDAAICGVQEALERVQQAEARAWEEQEGSAPEGQAWNTYLQRDATDYVGLPSRRCDNMMDRRFWSLS